MLCFSFFFFFWTHTFAVVETVCRGVKPKHIVTDSPADSLPVQVRSFRVRPLTEIPKTATYYMLHCLGRIAQVPGHISAVRVCPRQGPRNQVCCPRALPRGGDASETRWHNLFSPPISLKGYPAAADGLDHLHDSLTTAWHAPFEMRDIHCA